MFVEHKEAVELTPAKVLKLSEAIRIGAKIRPQGVGPNCWARGQSCALMAAYEGFFGVPAQRLGERLYMWASDIVGLAIQKEIWMRNDQGQTREQIADWLEGQGY